MNLDKLNNNAVLNIFKEKLGEVEAVLTGGAVVDILEDRVPKDYDFMYREILKNKMDEIATFKYISRTAITYDLAGYEVQLLKRDPSDFSFTIEQGEYSLKKSELKNFDKQSFNTKKLIPTTLVFKLDTDRSVNDKTSATESLMRIPHWQKKGYEIDFTTYSTIVRIATKIEVNHGS